MRCLAALAVMLLAACATPRAPRLSFDELYPARAPAPPAAPAAPRQAGAASARASGALHAALATFAVQGRTQRAASPRRNSMPPAHAARWEAFLGALDTFLALPAARTSSHDVVRAREALEAELAEDTRTYGSLPPALAEAALERVARLALRLAEVRALDVRAAPAPRERLGWPLEPALVTSLFGTRLHPITGETRRHLGVDLAARPGQAVHAAAAGTVTFAGRRGGHGNQVEVAHAGGVVTRYSHLARVLVEAGERVERGDRVGLAGSTGLSTGVHLHFELWREGEPCDPLEALLEGHPRAGRPALAEREEAPARRREGRRGATRRPP